jgi:hypothetical protein
MVMESQTSDAREAVRALDDRFQEHRAPIPVLARRADAENVKEICAYEDLIPLLFPHITYKSYPESLVTKGSWAHLNKWLDSLSTHRVDGVELSAVEDVDDWIECLGAAGHLVTSSSGTSGKASFLNKTARDRDASERDLIDCLTALGIPPGPEWHVIPVGPETGVTAHRVMRELVFANYGRPDAIALPEAAGAPAVRHHRYMARLAAMRKAMVDGTARPDDVADFEAEGARRREQAERWLRHYAEQILRRPGEPLLFMAMFPLLHRLTEILRELGANPGDLTGANALTCGGGLKGMDLPPDYRERILGLLNITPERFLHYYSMQDINLRMPKCLGGRYHVPDRLVLLVLDKGGEALAPVSDGQAEGRAAFFDFTIDGRWGGVISGDHIRADFGSCPCGRSGPTVFDDITRYSDLPDGDKITCAGTVDAYVRGFIDE